MYYDLKELLLSNDSARCLTPSKVDLLLQYMQETLAANNLFNLTSIIDPREFAIKHILDSLSAANLIPQGAKLCDVGSGAGFPAAPLAIARDDISVVAIDSTAKKTAFINSLAAKLGVLNLRAVCGRAEELTSLFNTFDAATARAVAPLNILLELCTPLLKQGGVFVAYKADDSEVSLATSAAKTLNMQLLSADKFTLANGDNRCLITYKKTAPTPKQYPRAYGAIKKRPL